MTYNEPMPWMEEGALPPDAYAEPEPPRPSLWSCRRHAIGMSFALLCISPVVLAALVFDVFSSDRTLWPEIKSTFQMIARMWRGEEKW